jgi:hypothetical protein
MELLLSSMHTLQRARANPGTNELALNAPSSIPIVPVNAAPYDSDALHGDYTTWLPQVNSHYQNYTNGATSLQQANTLATAAFRETLLWLLRSFLQFRVCFYDVLYVSVLMVGAIVRGTNLGTEDGLTMEPASVYKD